MKYSWGNFIIPARLPLACLQYTKNLQFKYGAIMEKYVEIRIAAHKLCDSSHNFMDRGIKRGKAVHTNTVILVSADAGDGKGKCGFTVILAAVKRNL